MTNKMKFVSLMAILTIAIVLPVYNLMEPARQEEIRQELLIDAVFKSTDMYAENCALCHGAMGEGIGTNPPLNTDALRTMSEADIFKVLARGIEGTVMAAWAVDEGGIFSNSQINDMVAFIQHANWSYVEQRVAELGLTPPPVIEMEVSEDMLAAVESLAGGEALSEGLVVYAEYCAACHGANGAGSMIAPAIDSAELRAKPREEMIQIINQGVSGTLMAGWQSVLDTNQIETVVDVIYRWPELVSGGIEFPEAPITSFPSSPEMIAAGQRLFNIACKSCHGTDGFGTPMGPALNNQIFLSQTPDAAIYQIIASGVPDTLMPGWGSRLSDQELQSLVVFLRSLEATAPPIVDPVTTP